MRIFMSSLLFLPTLALADVYVCSFNYFETLMSDKVSRTMAVFFDNECTKNKRTIFEKKLGEFSVRVLCDGDAHFEIKQNGKSLFNKTIEGSHFSNLYSESITTRKESSIRSSGLKWSCVAQDVAITVIESD